jgi:hypothetical protein
MPTPQGTEANPSLEGINLRDDIHDFLLSALSRLRLNKDKILRSARTVPCEGAILVGFLNILDGHIYVYVLLLYSNLFGTIVNERTSERACDSKYLSYRTSLIALPFVIDERWMD